MVSEPLFDYYDIHLDGPTVLVEEPEPATNDNDPDDDQYLDFQ